RKMPQGGHVQERQCAYPLDPTTLLLPKPLQNNDLVFPIANCHYPYSIAVCMKTGIKPRYSPVQATTPGVAAGAGTVPTVPTKIAHFCAAASAACEAVAPQPVWPAVVTLTVTPCDAAKSVKLVAAEAYV